MALARIITRSQACSRELALDLLARGYAVEIVTPDAVPDNIADLELRVEEDPGNQLVASVQAHDGARSASLDFVHHLRAPMADFVRRAPEPIEVIYLSGGPESLNIEPSFTPNIAQVELSAKDMQLAVETVPPAAPILLSPLSPGPVQADPVHADPVHADRAQEGASLFSLPDPLPRQSLEIVSETPSDLAEAPTIAWPVAEPITTPLSMVQPKRKPSRRGRFSGWQWRAALTFVSMVSLALALGFGLRRMERASTQVPGATSAEKVVAPLTDTYLLAAAAPEKNLQKEPGNVPGPVSNLALPPAIKSAGNSDRALNGSAVASTGAAVIKASMVSKTRVSKTRVNKTTVNKTMAGKTTVAKPRDSGWHHDDVIARDTVTYLDGRHQPAPKTQPAKQATRRPPILHKHSGVIAANSVTYLNKPSPKPAK
jgi:hypothetical protein